MPKPENFAYTYEVNDEETKPGEGKVFLYLPQPRRPYYSTQNLSEYPDGITNYQELMNAALKNYGLDIN
jgi:hypothetical protein